MEVLSLSPKVRGGEEQKKVFKLLRFSAYSYSVWKELFSSLYRSSLFEEQRNINIILVQWNLINYPSNREDIFMTFCCKEKLQEVPYLTPFFRDEKKHRERWCGGGGGKIFCCPSFLHTSPFLIRDFMHRAKKKNLNSSLSFGQAALTIFLLVLVNDFVRPGLDAVLFMCWT